jgi:transposase InsO family protein
MGEGTKRGGLTELQEQGLQRLEACAREGLTIRAYAKRERLSEQQLYQMAKVLRAKGVLAPSRRGGKPEPPRVRAERRPRFVEVQTHAVTRATSEWIDVAPSTWRARLPNGVVLEGSTDLVVALEALAKL